MYGQTIPNYAYTGQMPQELQADISLQNLVMLNNKSTFFYIGNVIGLEAKIYQVQKNPNQYTSAYINITGNQVKQHRMWCTLLTLVLGSIFIFPLFLMCCQFWQSFVNPAFQVPICTYEKLEVLLSMPSVRSCTLIVTDNALNKAKASYLYSIISRSGLKGFSFTNSCSPNNFREEEWSNFKQNMRPIKQLPIMTQIKWYDQVVI